MGVDLLWGLDCAHYQGIISWASVPARGKKWAIIKASQGSSFQDARYDFNMAGAKAAGLLVGAYHWLDHHTVGGSGTAQANHFWSVVSGDDLPLLVFDVEGDPPAHPTAWFATCKEFVARLRTLCGPTVRIVLYTTASSWWSRETPNPNMKAAPGMMPGGLWRAHWIGGPPASSGDARFGGFAGFAKADILQYGPAGLTNPDLTIANGADSGSDAGGDAFAGTMAELTEFFGGGVANQPPTISATRTPNGNAPLTVDFDASLSEDPESNNPLEYRWDQDGGAPFGGNDPTVSRVFSTAGTFVVNLKVTDTLGAFSTRVFTIRVSAAAAVDPDPREPCEDA